MAALFFTLTMAEYHWPEVRRVLARSAELSGDDAAATDLRSASGGGPRYNTDTNIYE